MKVRITRADINAVIESRRRCREGEVAKARDSRS